MKLPPGNLEKHLAALAQATARGASRETPRPAKPVRDVKAPLPLPSEGPVKERAVWHGRARDVAEIVERVERREAAAVAETAARVERKRHEVKASDRMRRALAEIQAGGTPDVDRSDDLCVVTVDHPDDLTARPARRAAVMSLRHDPVGRMCKRKQVTDLQLRAARRWQQYHEESEIGGARAIDYSVDRVDGGRLYDPYSTGRLDAAQVLKIVDRRLGEDGALLVRRVLAEKMELSQVANVMRTTSRGEIEFLGKFFRKCLDKIASIFGFVEATTGTGPKAGVDGKPTVRAESYGPKAGVQMHAWNYQPPDGGR